MQIRPWPEVVAILPPLSASEQADLRRSVEEFGVQYPVLLLPDGRIIDGHHRWEASGGTAPTKVLAVDEETGFALALALNLSRRHLPPERTVEVRALLRRNREVARRVVGEMTEQGKTQAEIGEAIGYSQEGVSKIQREDSLHSTSTSTTTTDDGNTKRRKIPLEDYDQIVSRKAAGESWATIGQTYGVGDSAVHQFVQRAEERIANPDRPDPRRKLTDEQEHEIASRARGGEGHEALAAEYGVSRATLGNAIRRARQRADGPIEPSNHVIDFEAKARQRATTRPAPPKTRVRPEVVQREAMRWLREARLLRDKLSGLSSRFGETLAEALATSEEGEVMGRELERMAQELQAFAITIRRGSAGQEDQRHGSTTG